MPVNHLVVLLTHHHQAQLTVTLRIQWLTVHFIGQNGLQFSTILGFIARRGIIGDEFALSDLIIGKGHRVPILGFELDGHTGIGPTNHLDQFR